ncbi:MAG: hypothetical protein ACTSV0_04575 [Candidatus Freyarchaeota archaeon]
MSSVKKRIGSCQTAPRGTIQSTLPVPMMRWFNQREIEGGVLTHTLDIPERIPHHECIANMNVFNKTTNISSRRRLGSIQTLPQPREL